ncbi:MAG: hypothetical protein PHC85_03210, partial [Candidatus Pacebacteria bacterium]|nr:hypothetical protein [Candidatus Paceibacterota bacterium]
MKKVSDFLFKFFNFPPPSELIEGEIKKIIENELGIKPEFYKLSVKNKKIFLSSVNPVIKNEIYINKNKILKKI